MQLGVDLFRWLLWLICKGAFFIMDELYKAIEIVASFNIADNDTLWKWWSLICGFIFLLVIIRVFSMLIRMGINDEYKNRVDPFNIIVKIGAIAAIILFMPITVSTLTSFTSEMITNSSNIFTVANNVIEYRPEKTGNPEIDEYVETIINEYQGMPSYLVYSSAADGVYPPYQLIDINSKTGLEGWLNQNFIPGSGYIMSFLFGSDGEYYYFPDTTALIFLIVISIMACFAIVLISFEFGKRTIDIGFLILISPYPISSLVTEGDETLGRWTKILVANLLNNFLQIMLFKFVLVIVSCDAVAQLGLIARIIFFIGGLLAVLTGPSSIAQIIGGDGMGTFQTMQALHTATALTHGMQAAGKAVGSAALTAGSAAIYGGGRILGGKSLAGHDLGGTSEAGIPGVGTNGFAAFNDERNGINGASSMDSAYFKEPTGKQMKAAEKRGIDPQGMNRGQLSQALQKAGMDKSYWGDEPKTFENTAAHNTGNTGGASFSTQNAGITDTYTSEDNNRNGSSAGQIHLSREGSLARKFVDKPSSIRQGAARLSGSLYMASANRLFGQKSVQTRKGYVTKNTAAQSLSNAAHMLSIKKPQQSIMKGEEA